MINALKLTYEEIISNMEENVQNLAYIVLFKNRISISGLPINKKELPCPRIREEHIFDDCKAYTWVGKYGRLGSLNLYPCMPGCYQTRTWGLGWQSAPVAFLVDGESFNFLRWYVKEGDNIRSHPVEERYSFLSKQALFTENVYPDVETRCSQKDNFLVVVRNMSRVCNRASVIADDWKINNFKGEWVKVVIEKEDDLQEWIVLNFSNASFAILPLYSIQFGASKREKPKIAVFDDRGSLIVRQSLYDGKEKQILSNRLESAWFTCFIDGVKKQDEIKSYLSTINIQDKSYNDFEVARNPCTFLRDVHVKLEGREILHLLVDPHDSVLRQHQKTKEE